MKSRQDCEYPAAAEEVVDLKLANKLAASVAAFVVILLSCPLWGQEEGSARHPLPPNGGQPAWAGEISVGQPMPEPDASDPTISAGGETNPVYARDREPIKLELRNHRVRIERLEARKGFRATVTPRRGRGVARVVQAPTLDQLVASLREKGFVTDADLASLRAALDQLRKELGTERAARQAADEGIQGEISRLSRLTEVWIAKNFPLVLFLGALAFGLVVAVFGAITLLGIAYRN